MVAASFMVKSLMLDWRELLHNRFWDGADHLKAWARDTSCKILLMEIWRRTGAGELAPWSHHSFQIDE